MKSVPKLKDTAACMTAIRNILGTPRIYKVAGIKKSQLSRYCKDPEVDVSDDSDKDILLKTILLTTEILGEGEKDLNYAILSTIVAPSGYKLVPLLDEGCAKKASTLEACIESSQALVNLHTSMCAFEGIGIIATLADKAHKAIDLSVSKWMKAKEDRETPKRTALSKIFDGDENYEPE